VTAFAVWAPHAERVDLVLGESDERLPMTAGERGWWTVDVPPGPGVSPEITAGPGTDYAFSLDGGPPLPDPRSPFQPHGVHRPSRTVDHDAFAWTDQQWRGGAPLPSALLYELHVGTFTPEGTFESAIERLGELVDLGVTHVELMPVCEFPGRRGWGYDGVDLFAPHHAYGGPEGLKRLVDACHRAGLAVIIDVVYNHLGPDGNYLGAYGPYFTDRYNTPWGQAVNFDGTGSDEVRNFVGDNACMWLADYHADGLRLDAVHAIFDSSATDILEELGGRVAALEARLGRRLHVIAESDLNDPRLIRSVEAGGCGLDAAWSDDFHHALHSVLTGERTGYYEDFGDLAHLAAAWERGYVYDGRFSSHRGRRHGRPVDQLPGHRLLGYLQNHDQVGNRATGERSAALMSAGRLKIGAALVLTAPFVPLLFAGEEWAASSPFLYFTDHQDAGLGLAVSEGRRREFASFGWDPADVPDPQDLSTFERSKLDWAEREKEPHASVLEWHRSLVALRRRLPALCDGRYGRARFDEAAGWLVLERGAVTVTVNLSARAQAVPLTSSTGTVLLASDISGTPRTPGTTGTPRTPGPYTRLDGDNIELPAESVAIIGPA
jgi:maltooligosyltrehalose trehalohydrolase